MRVLVASHNYPRREGDPAGAFVARLARGCVALGDEVQAVVPHSAGLAEQESAGGVTVRRFRYGPDTWERVAYTGHLHHGFLTEPRRMVMIPPFLSRFRSTVRAVAAAWPPDVIHAHWWIPAGWAASGVGRPLVITCHGSDVPLLDGYGLLSLLAHRVLRRAAAVTTVSEFLRRRVVAAVPEIAARCIVLPMPLEVGRFERGRQEPRATPPRILYAGNLVTSKGVDVLIRAVSHLVRDGHPVQLRILGEGPDTARLTSLVKSLALEDVVAILPFVGQEQMPAEYGAATVTVLPTRGDAEGLGLTLVEALLAGCAVVGSRAGGIPEVVVPEQTGLAFHDGDEIDLAAQLARLLTDGPLRERLTEEGARRARANFEPLAAAERFHSLYEDVAADSSR
jgi:glycosyltransferase involved in cell wall biosynthesis